VGDCNCSRAPTRRRSRRGPFAVDELGVEPVPSKSACGQVGRPPRDMTSTDWAALAVQWSAVEERVTGLTEELLVRTLPVLDRIAGRRLGMPLRPRAAATRLSWLLASWSSRIRIVPSTPAESKSHRRYRPRLEPRPLRLTRPSRHVGRAQRSQARSMTCDLTTGAFHLSGGETGNRVLPAHTKWRSAKSPGHLVEQPGPRPRPGRRCTSRAGAGALLHRPRRRHPRPPFRRRGGTRNPSA
jgi:hypothetical protein